MELLYSKDVDHLLPPPLEGFSGGLADLVNHQSENQVNSKVIVNLSFLSRQRIKKPLTKFAICNLQFSFHISHSLGILSYVSRRMTRVRSILASLFLLSISFVQGIIV